jgi:competence protein ComEA
MSSDTPEPHWLLRRADQATVAVLVLAGLTATVGWWFATGGWGGRLVEIDSAEPQQAIFQVDINQAEWVELAQLPGIGRELAERIVTSRRKEGPFRSHEELRRVKGIGERTMTRIRPYLLPIAEPETKEPSKEKAKAASEEQ